MSDMNGIEITEFQQKLKLNGFVQPLAGLIVQPAAAQFPKFFLSILK